MDNIFSGLFDTSITSVISVNDFILCIIVSLVLGLILAFVYKFKATYTKSFMTTLALLPTIVCVVIMLVNGNVGTGVAVAGAFSLVRFRSVPGSAKEICAIFIAMAIGLICGMGYLAYGALFTIIMAIVFLIYNNLDLGYEKNTLKHKTISITIPEDLDYSDVFEDIFKTFTSKYDLVQVKTTNMGSMFKLTYNIILKDIKKEKMMIDEIRCRNGNLEISISHRETVSYEL